MPHAFAQEENHANIGSNSKASKTSAAKKSSELPAGVEPALSPEQARLYGEMAMYFKAMPSAALTQFQLQQKLKIAKSLVIENAQVLTSGDVDDVYYQQKPYPTPAPDSAMGIYKTPENKKLDKGFLHPPGLQRDSNLTTRYPNSQMAAGNGVWLLQWVPQPRDLAPPLQRAAQTRDLAPGALQKPDTCHEEKCTCGAALPALANFCSECGKRVHGRQTVTSGAPGLARLGGASVLQHMKSMSLDGSGAMISGNSMSLSGSGAMISGIPHITDSVPHPNDSMKSHLEALRQEDPATILVVRGISKLGFESKEFLTSHFSRYGKVKEIYVSHPAIKVKRQVWDRRAYAPDSQFRWRVAQTCFVVMYSAEAVAWILAEGEDHVVQGVAVRLLPFHGHAHENDNGVGGEDMVVFKDLGSV